MMISGNGRASGRIVFALARPHYPRDPRHKGRDRPPPTHPVDVSKRATELAAPGAFPLLGSQASRYRLARSHQGGLLLFYSPSRTRSLATGILFATALAGSACGDDSTSATGTMTMTGTDTDSGSDTGTGSSVTITTSGVSLDDTGTADGTDTLVDSSGGPSTTSPSTGSTSDDTTTGDTDTDTDSTTGGEVLPGQTMNQLVSAGTKASSTNYTLVFTFGQPSTLQSTHDSTNYRLQGGLVGANGSPP